MHNDDKIKGHAGNVLIKLPSQAQESQIQGIMSVAGIALLAGAEALRVLLRTEIHESKFAFSAIMAAAVMYASYAAWVYINVLPHAQPGSFDSSFITAAVAFYFVLAFGVLVCGIIEWRKAKSGVEKHREDYENTHRGKSIFFSFLLAKGYKQQVIWKNIEPLACITVSIILTLLRPLVGLPLLISSISFFYNEWDELVWKPKAHQRMIRAQLHAAKGGNYQKPEEDFHSVSD